MKIKEILTLSFNLVEFVSEDVDHTEGCHCHPESNFLIIALVLTLAYLDVSVLILPDQRPSSQFEAA
jgi:hypothetical protein